jgi:hypothetical protein
MKNFKETQRIKIWWMWAPLIAINLLFAYIFVQQIIVGQPFGRTPLPNGIIITLFLICAGMLTFCLLISFKLRIDEEGIHYKYTPFRRKYTTITWYHVSDAYVRDYEPLYEYGGWGIKGTLKNRAYNMSGKTGLQLVLRDGNKVILGTLRPVEVKAIAQYYFRP